MKDITMETMKDFINKMYKYTLLLLKNFLTFAFLFAGFVISNLIISFLVSIAIFSSIFINIFIVNLLINLAFLMGFSSPTMLFIIVPINIIVNSMCYLLLFTVIVPNSIDFLGKSIDFLKSRIRLFNELKQSNLDIKLLYDCLTLPRSTTNIILMLYQEERKYLSNLLQENVISLKDIDQLCNISNNTNCTLTSNLDFILKLFKYKFIKTLQKPNAIDYVLQYKDSYCKIFRLIEENPEHTPIYQLCYKILQKSNNPIQIADKLSKIIKEKLSKITKEKLSKITKDELYLVRHNVIPLSVIFSDDKDQQIRDIKMGIVYNRIFRTTENETDNSNKNNLAFYDISPLIFQHLSAKDIVNLYKPSSYREKIKQGEEERSFSQVGSL